MRSLPRRAVCIQGTSPAMAPNVSLTLPPDVAKVVDSVVATQAVKTPRFLAEPGSGSRDGYTSDVYRITISDEAEPDRAPLIIICKRSKSIWGELMKQMFTTEAVMYEKVLPVLEDVARLQEPLPWPRCFYSSVHDEPPHVVALGDLRPSGFAMADRTELMDAAHCYAAVPQLAALHGAGLALKHLRPDEFDKARQLVRRNPWAHPDMKNTNRLFHLAALKMPDAMKDKFPEGSEVNKSLVQLFNAFVDHREAFMGPAEAPGHTFIHSDCHVNNLMFQYDKSGAVTGCRLIDFQTAFYGNPGMDLCLLLLTCTEKGVRDQHWDRLMREYHAKLHETLRAAGCDRPDAIHSWELFQSQLAAASVYALGMLPMYYIGLYGTDEDVAEVKAMMANIGNGGDASPNIDVKVTPRYKRCLEDVVQHMVDRGWLPSVAEIDRLVAAYA